MITKKHILLSLLIIIFCITSVSAINDTAINDNTHHIQDNTIQQTDNTYKIDENDKNIKTDKSTHYITNNNIKQYFDESGEIIPDSISDGNTIVINDTIKDRQFYLTDIQLTLTSTNKNNQLINTKIYAEGNNIKITNLRINNDNIDTAIEIRSSNTSIENCDITCKSTQDVYGIYLIANKSTIKNNNINITGPSDEIKWDTDVARTLALTVIGSNNSIENNTISVYSNTSKAQHGTIEAVSIQGDYAGRRAENNTFKDNTVYADGINYAYGVNLGQYIDGNQIINNNITTKGGNFADSLQLFSTASNLKILNNNITATSNNLADGIVISKDNMQGKTENNTITNNTIKVTGNNTNLIEIYRAKNVTISQNNITSTANNTNGITFTGTNANILKNNITITSKDNKTNPISAKSSQDVSIKDNNVKSNCIYSVDITNSTKTNVTDNILNSIIKGDKSVKSDSNTNIVKNNQEDVILQTRTVVNSVNGYINSSTNIYAQVIDENQNPVNRGYVIFKVDGQTLKDENNTIIKAYVNNSEASIDYIIPKSWNKEGITIQAVYSGSGNLQSSRSNSSSIEVYKRVALIQPLTTFARITGGRTIQLSVLVTDKLNNNHIITGGQVIFKINGKTIKDENNKNIVANISNGLGSIIYNVPYGLSSKNVTITAVYSNSIYERAEGKTYMFIDKSQAFIDVAPVTTSTNKTRIQATIYEANNYLVKGITQVAIKINGKTVLKTAADNGVIDAVIDTPYKPNTYTLLIVAGENNRYLAATKETKIIKLAN